MQARENIQNLPSIIHGGKKYSATTADDVLDFSVNCNPYGAPPGIKSIIKSTTIYDYPDTESTQLRKALAHKFGLEAENILIGNGSTEIIRLIASAYINSGDKVLILQPTYSRLRDSLPYHER